MQNDSKNMNAGKARDGRLPREVLVESTRFAEILEAVKAYNRIGDPRLPSCAARADRTDTLVFLLPEKARAVDAGASGKKMDSQAGLELASTLVQIATKLNAAGLGLWRADRRLWFETDAGLTIIPMFWVPFLSDSAIRGAKTLPPEIQTGQSAAAYSPQADVFAISYACYEALAGVPPSFPSPKLPGEWDASLSRWDAALDAGLRARPERRPGSAREWEMLLAPRAIESPRVAVPPAPPPPVETRVRPPGRFQLTALLGVLLLALVAGGLWRFRHSIPTTVHFSSVDYERGFGPYIVRYARRDYTSAQWRVIHSDAKIQVPGVRFDYMTGWDTNNLLVCGLADDSVGKGQVFTEFRLIDGTWSFTQFRNGAYVNPKVLFLDKGTFLLSCCGQNGGQSIDLLTLTEPEGTRQLAPHGFPVTSWGGICPMYATDKDTYFCNVTSRAENKAGVYTYGNEQVKRAADSMSVIVDEKNHPIKRSDTPMLAADIRIVSALQSGQAVGLWQPYRWQPYHQSEDPDPVALVRFRNGVWQLTKLFEEQVGPIFSAWFLDESNGVAVGKSEVRVLKNGRLLRQQITMSGQDFTAQEYVRAWGRSMEDYFVLDKRGTVFHCISGNWVLEVQGPDLKNDKSAGDTRERAGFFNDCWVSPEGAVYGVRDKEIYELD